MYIYIYIYICMLIFLAFFCVLYVCMVQSLHELLCPWFASWKNRVWRARGTHARHTSVVVTSIVWVKIGRCWVVFDLKLGVAQPWVLNVIFKTSGDYMVSSNDSSGESRSWRSMSTLRICSSTRMAPVYPTVGKNWCPTRSRIGKPCRT